MAAAAADSAVVFLQTNLGTRLVVSFPSHGTTVADLKRQVSAQHSVCFPRTGPIAVTSLQVKRDGCWYVLSDRIDVQAVFGGVEGTWHLRVEADAECGAGDAERSASHPISQKPMQNLSPPPAPQGDANLALFGIVSPTTNKQAFGQPENANTMHQQDSGLDVAAGDGDTAPTSHQDKPQEFLEYVSGQREEGSNNMDHQSSNLVVAAADNDVPPLSREDKPHQGIDYACDQRKDENTMPEQSSDHDAAAYKDNGPLRGQQKGTIMYTRGKKRVREEDANNRSNAIKLDGRHTSLSSSTFLVESSRTEQEDLYQSHVFVRKPSSSQEKTWTHGVYNGESSHNGSDFPPCVESMEGQKSSDKEVRAHISKVQELQITGLCTGQSNINETETPHCAEPMKEDSRRPTSSGHYLHKEEYEGDKSTVIAEHESCFPRTRSQRLVAVRKVPVRMVKKMYASSSTDNHQEHSLKCNNGGAQKMPEKKGAQKLNKQKDLKVAVRSSPRFTNTGVPIGEKAVMRKIEHNLEVPGAGTVLPDQSAQEERGARKGQKGQRRK